jgi:nicotinamidase-related amidase
VHNPALIIVDVQKGFDDPYWGIRNNPHAEDNIALLLATWRERNLPIFHVQHLSTEPQSPLRPGQAGCEFKAIVKPLSGEPVITKHVNSSFIGTSLERMLNDKGIHTLVITGLSTDHCVSTTTRMAGNLGFITYVVADATATFNRKGFNGQKFTAEEIHHSALASLHKEFATVLTTCDLLVILDHLQNFQSSSVPI